MKPLKSLLLVFSLLLPTNALALPGIPDIPTDPGGACDALGGGGICDWVDFAMSLSDQLNTMFEQFNQEITDMGENLFGEATGWLQDTLAGLTQTIDTGGLEQAMGDIEQAIEQGPSEFRRRIQGAIRDLTQAQLTELWQAPEDSPDGRYNQAVQTFPALAGAEVVTARQKERSSVLRAESAAAAETSFKTGAVVQQNTAAQDTAQSILGPGGDAETLENDVNTSVSTRAAVQALTEGIADTMRHDASFQANLASVVKSLNQQQVMTNWQMQLLVSSLTDQYEAEMAAAQTQLQGQITEVYREADAIGRSFTNSLMMGVEMLEADVTGLNTGDLGW